MRKRSPVGLFIEQWGVIDLNWVLTDASVIAKICLTIFLKFGYSNFYEGFHGWFTKRSAKIFSFDVSNLVLNPLKSFNAYGLQSKETRDCQELEKKSGDSYPSIFTYFHPAHFLCRVHFFFYCKKNKKKQIKNPSLTILSVPTIITNMTSCDISQS